MLLLSFCESCEFFSTKFICSFYCTQDQAYDHFVREGVYPYPSRPLVFSDSHIWFLRCNQLFWAMLLCVLPTCWLWWQIIVVGLVEWVAVVFGLGFIGSESISLIKFNMLHADASTTPFFSPAAIISYGLLRFSQQTHNT